MSVLPQSLSYPRKTESLGVPDVPPEPSRSWDMQSCSGDHENYVPPLYVPHILHVFPFHLSGEAIIGPGLQIWLIGKQATSQ